MEADETDALSLETLHGLLGRRRRQHVLACLNQHDELALADLAEEVAVRECDEPITEISEDAVLRIYTSLWHAHVPRLADANVVEYDQDRDVVSLGANAAQLEQYLPSDAPGQVAP